MVLKQKQSKECMQQVPLGLVRFAKLGLDLEEIGNKCYFNSMFGLKNFLDLKSWVFIEFSKIYNFEI